jgi:hypothetical protein
MVPLGKLPVVVNHCQRCSSDLKLNQFGTFGEKNLKLALSYTLPIINVAQ